MNRIRMFGAAACCALAAAVSAAEVTVSELTGGAKQGTLELKAKNRVANGAFTVTAIPVRFAGLPIVSVPRGQGNQPGAGYSVTIDRPAAVYLFVHNRGKATLPEGWAKVPGIVEWEANGQPMTDTVYVKECPAGKVEVPAHDGKEGTNFGIPNTIVVADRNLESESPAVLSLCSAKSKMRIANGVFAIAEIPDSLKGLPMVSVPRGDGSKPGAAFSYTLAKPAKVYLLVHNRGKVTLPEGWTKEEGKVTWKSGATPFTDTVYSRECPAGKLDVPAHDGKEGNTFGIPNAIVIAYK